MFAEEHVCTEDKSSDVVSKVLDYCTRATLDDLQNARSVAFHIPQESLYGGLHMRGIDLCRPTGIYRHIHTAVSNLRQHFGPDEQITVRLDGNEHAGAIFNAHMSSGKPYPASLNQFIVRGNGDGRRGEQGLARAIENSGRKLTKVDLGQVTVNGSAVLSKLRETDNGVTDLKMLNSRATPDDVANTLTSAKNNLEDLEAGLEVPTGGNIQSLSDAMVHPNCKLRRAWLILDTNVSLAPLITAIQHADFKPKDLELHVNMSTSPGEISSLTLKAAEKNVKLRVRWTGRDQGVVRTGGEQGKADAIEEWGELLSEVDMGKSEVDGHILLSTLRDKENGVTILKMPRSRAAPNDLANTLKSLKNKLERIDVGLKVPKGGSIESVSDAMFHQNCKLIRVRLVIDGNVSLASLTAAIENPEFKPKELELVLNPSTSGEERERLASAAKARNVTLTIGNARDALRR